jgi:hypothetical protein
LSLASAGITIRSDLINSISALAPYRTEGSGAGLLRADIRAVPRDASQKDANNKQKERGKEYFETSSSQEQH